MEYRTAIGVYIERHRERHRERVTHREREIVMYCAI